MSRRARQRWTRESYKKAHHLTRLLPRLHDIPDMPPLVERFHDLINRTPGLHGMDPLMRPLSERHWDRFGDPDVPF